MTLDMEFPVRFIARGVDGKELLRETVELDHRITGQKALSTPLVLLRQYAPGMLPGAYFCLSDGTLISDAMKLDEYLNLEADAAEDDSTSTAVPAIVRYTYDSLSSAPQDLDDSPFLLKVHYLRNDGAYEPYCGIQSRDLGAAPLSTTLKSLRSLIYPPISTSLNVFCLEDGTALQNEDDMLSDVFNAQPQTLYSEQEKFTLPKVTVKSIHFKHRTTQLNPTQQRPETGTPPAPGKDIVGPKPPKDASDSTPKPAFTQADIDNMLKEIAVSVKLDNLRTNVGFPTASLLSSRLNPADYTVKSVPRDPYPTELTEQQWDTVIQSNALFNGWVIDSAGQRVSKAPLPAFKLRRGLNIMNIDAHDVAQGETIDLPGYVKLGIPNFYVTDSSRVTITATDSQFKQSLAVNAFASAATENSGAAVLFSTGVPALVGVSSSWAGSVAVGVGKTSAGAESIMRGSYEFPRVTIVFTEEDIELSDQMEDFIDKKLRKAPPEKILQNLVRFHQLFGHIFPTKVTLGGRLHTSKHFSALTEANALQVKEQFKLAMAASIKMLSLVSVKHSANISQDSSTDKEREQKSSSEELMWEAQGGNTLLATSPSDWVPSVQSFYNWRVIDQDDLMDMHEMLRWFPAHGDVVANVERLVKATDPKPPQNLPPSMPGDITTKPSYMSGYFKAQYQYSAGVFRRQTWRSEPSAWFCVSLGWAGNQAKAWPYHIGSFSTRFARMLPDGTQTIVYTPTNDNSMASLSVADSALELRWRFCDPTGGTITAGTPIQIQDPHNPPADARQRGLVTYRASNGLFHLFVTDRQAPGMLPYWRLVPADGSSTIQNGTRVRVSYRFGGFSQEYDDFRPGKQEMRKWTEPDMEGKTYWLKVVRDSYAVVDGPNYYPTLLVPADQTAVSRSSWEGVHSMSNADEPGDLPLQFVEWVYQSA